MYLEISGHTEAYAIQDQFTKQQYEAAIIALQWILSHIGLKGNEIRGYISKTRYHWRWIQQLPTTLFQLHKDSFHKIEKINVAIDFTRRYIDKRSKKGYITENEPTKSSNPSWIDKATFNRCVTVSALKLRSGHYCCFTILLNEKDCRWRLSHPDEMCPERPPQSTPAPRCNRRLQLFPGRASVGGCENTL